MVAYGIGTRARRGNEPTWISDTENVVRGSRICCRDSSKNTISDTSIGNDAGVITERDPDTVRGADVAFYSYRRVPKDAEPEGYPDAIPEFVFEVLVAGQSLAGDPRKDRRVSPGRREMSSAFWTLMNGSFTATCRTTARKS